MKIGGGETAASMGSYPPEGWGSPAKKTSAFFIVSLINSCKTGLAGCAPGKDYIGSASFRGMTWTDVALKEAITLLPSSSARLSTDWRVT